MIIRCKTGYCACWTICGGTTAISCIRFAVLIRYVVQDLKVPLIPTSRSPLSSTVLRLSSCVVAVVTNKDFINHHL